jgi:hypothetical protein
VAVAPLQRLRNSEDRAAGAGVDGVAAGAVLLHDDIVVGSDEEDVQTAIRRVLRVEGEREQTPEAPPSDASSEIQEYVLFPGVAIDRADPSVLVDDVEHVRLTARSRHVDGVSKARRDQGEAELVERPAPAAAGVGAPAASC